MTVVFLRSKEVFIYIVFFCERVSKFQILNFAWWSVLDGLDHGLFKLFYSGGADDRVRAVNQIDASFDKAPSAVAVGEILLL